MCCAVLFCGLCSLVCPQCNCQLVCSQEEAMETSDEWAASTSYFETLERCLEEVRPSSRWDSGMFLIALRMMG